MDTKRFPGCLETALDVTQLHSEERYEEAWQRLRQHRRFSDQMDVVDAVMIN